MGHFYGSVEGNRGPATRLGSKASGLTTIAAGWKGSVETYVYVDSDGDDCYRITIGPWQNGGPRERVIAEGKFKTLQEEDCR